MEFVTKVQESSNILQELRFATAGDFCPDSTLWPRFQKKKKHPGADASSRSGPGPAEPGGYGNQPAAHPVRPRAPSVGLTNPIVCLQLRQHATLPNVLSR